MTIDDKVWTECYRQKIDLRIKSKYGIYVCGDGKINNCPYQSMNFKYEHGSQQYYWCQDKRKD